MVVNCLGGMDPQDLGHPLGAQLCHLQLKVLEHLKMLIFDLMSLRV